MTQYESAIHELAERLQGADASLTTSIAEILRTTLQELIEAELTSVIGAGPGERIPTRTAQRNGHRPKLLSTPAGDVEVGIPSCGPDRSSRSCSSPAGGSTRRCGR